VEKYTVEFSGRKTIYARDLLDAVSSVKKDISYTHPSLNLKVDSVEFPLEEE